MNNRKRWAVRGLVLVFACLASVAWADDTLVLQNAGAWSAMGGVYTSPYGITVNGTPTLLICDDFETDVYQGDTWDANPVTLTQISSTTVSGLKFDSSPYNSGILGGAGNAVEDYATAAVLAAELLALPNVGTPAENTEKAGELSYAIWSVFDNSLYQSLNSTGWTGYGSLSTGPNSEVAAVDAYIFNAQNLVNGTTTNLDSISIGGQSINSLTVYTPNPLNASQEFLQVQMPEPGYPLMLGLDLVGAAGVILAFRRRKSKIKA
jgi:hypothetical protein